LPQVLMAGPIAELTEPDAAGAVGERFERFLRHVDETPELAQTLASVPFASLTSAVSKADQGLKKQLRERLKPGAVAAGPRLMPGSGASAGAAVAGASVAAAAASAGQGAAKAPVVPAQALDVDVGGAAGGRGGAISGALASRMRRIAADELAKMRSSHPDRYKDLKRVYLESLDEVGRRLMVDVQRRMQPTMFEEHLRQRLVRFMVDNPGAWRSSDARQAP
jgi:hypothetical protein